MRKTLLIVLLLLPLMAQASWSLKPKVIRNYDGDTITVLFEVWINTHVEANVRVMGVDTPEIRGAKCPEEKALAIKAREFTKQALKGDVMIDVVGEDSYPGRVDGWVYINGVGLDKLLIDAGLGHPYTYGIDEPGGWCKP